MPYSPTFEAWWRANKNLFNAELNRRSKALSGFGYSPIPVNNTALLEQIKVEVSQIFHETQPEQIYDQAISFNDFNSPQNSFSEASILAEKYEKRNAHIKSQPLYYGMVPHTPASQIHTHCFARYYPETINYSPSEICDILLNTFMTMANKVEEGGVTEGAELSMVWVANDAIYVLNIGNAPVYLSQFNDNNPANVHTSLISYWHHVKDRTEAQHLQNLGGQINDNKVGEYQHTRSLGDHTDHGFPVFGVSILPTITKVPFYAPSGRVLINPQNCHITACSSAFPLVCSAEKVGEFARNARDTGQHTIAAVLAQEAHAIMDMDVAVMDVPISPGQIICIVDGHGVENQNRPHKVLEIVKAHLEPLLLMNIAKYNKVAESNKVVSSNEEPKSSEEKKRGRPPLPEHMKKVVKQPVTYSSRGRPRKDKSAGAAKHEQNINSGQSTPNSNTNASLEKSPSEHKPSKI